MAGQSNRSGETKVNNIQSAEQCASFRLQSVDKARTPRGTEGEDWYRFVIDGEGTQIVSYRRGARDSVLQSIERYVESLNGQSRAEARDTLH